MPKSHCICCSIISIDSVFKMGKSYYLQVFLEECKYFIKEKRVERYFDGDYELETTSEDLVCEYGYQVSI